MYRILLIRRLKKITEIFGIFEEELNSVLYFLTPILLFDIISNISRVISIYNRKTDTVIILSSKQITRSNDKNI